MNKDKSKFYYTTSILILSAVVIVLLTYIILFTMFSASVKNQLGWESSSNAIGLAGLITSIITIVFVFKTYQSQREQIADQKTELKETRSNAEFNRALDIIYKHIKYTDSQLHIYNKRAEGVKVIYNDVKLYIKGYNKMIDLDPENTNQYRHDMIECILNYCSYCGEFYVLFATDLRLYIKVAYSRELSRNQIMILNTIIDQTMFWKLKSYTSEVIKTLDSTLRFIKRNDNSSIIALGHDEESLFDNVKNVIDDYKRVRSLFRSFDSNTFDEHIEAVRSEWCL